MTENTEEKIPLPSSLKQPQDSAPGNPLTQYFRHPKLQIELPTGGKFWTEGSLELKEGKYLDVMPMTARDEIIMKSPEGLLSGTSLAETICSCIPGIKDAWEIPANDLDTILIAIRLASYEHDMEFNSSCPHCKEVNTNAIDLRILLDSIPRGTINNVFKIDDLTFEFKPYTFRFVNENNRAKFEQEQLAKTMAGSNMSDNEKKAYFHGVFSKLADHNTDTLVRAISKISMPAGAVVSNKEHIKDFIDNADRHTIKAIRDKLEVMAMITSLKPIKITCDHCEEEYDTGVEFNQSNFFA